MFLFHSWIFPLTEDIPRWPPLITCGNLLSLPISDFRWRWKDEMERKRSAGRRTTTWTRKREVKLNLWRAMGKKIPWRGKTIRLLAKSRSLSWKDEWLFTKSSSSICTLFMWPSSINIPLATFFIPHMHTVTGHTDNEKTSMQKNPTNLEEWQNFRT